MHCAKHGIIIVRLFHVVYGVKGLRGLGYEEDLFALVDLDSALTYYMYLYSAEEYLWPEQNNSCSRRWHQREEDSLLI